MRNILFTNLYFSAEMMTELNVHGHCFSFLTSNLGRILSNIFDGTFGENG